MVEISTSILNVEKTDAMKVFYGLEVAHTDYFHIDVMDRKVCKKRYCRTYERIFKFNKTNIKYSTRCASYGRKCKRIYR